MRFRTVPAQMADEDPDTVPAMADEVPECSGTHSVPVQMVPAQMADEVPAGSGADG